MRLHSAPRPPNPLSQADETLHGFDLLVVSVYFAIAHGRTAFRG